MDTDSDEAGIVFWMGFKRDRDQLERLLSNDNLANCPTCALAQEGSEEVKDAPDLCAGFKIRYLMRVIGEAAGKTLKGKIRMAIWQVAPR